MNKPTTIHTMDSNYGDGIYIIIGKVSNVKACGLTIGTIQTSESYIGCKSRPSHSKSLYMKKKTSQNNVYIPILYNINLNLELFYGFINTKTVWV